MKKIVTLIVALVVLLGVWYLVSGRNKSGGVSEPQQATHADTLTVNKVVLKRWNQPDVVLTKDAGGIWNLAEPLQQKANQNLALQMVRGLATMKLEDLVSSRKEMQANFRLDETEAPRMQAYDGDDKVADVYVGKLAQDNVHVYVREAGSDDIWAATGGGAMARFATRQVDDFRDHTIIDADFTLVDSVHITTAAHNFYIARADSTSWKIKVGDKGQFKPAQKTLTEGIVRGLAALRASGFGDSTTTVEWSKPAAQVEIFLMGRDPVSVTMQPVEGATDYWAKVKGNPLVYKVFESSFKSLDRDPKTLLESS